MEEMRDAHAGSRLGRLRLAAAYFAHPPAVSPTILRSPTMLRSPTRRVHFTVDEEAGHHQVVYQGPPGRSTDDVVADIAAGSGDHKFSIAEMDDTAKMMLVTLDEGGIAVGDAEELPDDSGNVFYSRERKYRVAFIQEMFLNDMTEDLNAIKDSAAEEDAAAAAASAAKKPASKPRKEVVPLPARVKPPARDRGAGGREADRQGTLHRQRRAL